FSPTTRSLFGGRAEGKPPGAASSAEFEAAVWAGGGEAASGRPPELPAPALALASRLLALTRGWVASHPAVQCAGATSFRRRAPLQPSERLPRPRRQPRAGSRWTGSSSRRSATASRTTASRVVPALATPPRSACA